MNALLFEKRLVIVLTIGSFSLTYLLLALIAFVDFATALKCASVDDNFGTFLAGNAAFAIFEVLSGVGYFPVGAQRHWLVLLGPILLGIFSLRFPIFAEVAKIRRIAVMIRVSIILGIASAFLLKDSLSNDMCSGL